MSQKRSQVALTMITETISASIDNAAVRAIRETPVNSESGTTVGRLIKVASQYFSLNTISKTSTLIKMPQQRIFWGLLAVANQKNQGSVTQTGSYAAQHGLRSSGLESGSSPCWLKLVSDKYYNSCPKTSSDILVELEIR